MSKTSIYPQIHKITIIFVFCNFNFKINIIINIYVRIFIRFSLLSVGRVRHWLFEYSTLRLFEYIGHVESVSDPGFWVDYESVFRVRP